MRKELCYHLLARAFGKNYAIAQMCKHDRKHGIMVRDREAMDPFIRLGVQPSQIIVLSEQNRSSQIKIMGMD